MIGTEDFKQEPGSWTRPDSDVRVLFTEVDPRNFPYTPALPGCSLRLLNLHSLSLSSSYADERPDGGPNTVSVPPDTS